MTTPAKPPFKILFVCLGNICRSPAAEGAFAREAEAAGLAGRVAWDSAGTGDWHVGQAPDRRSQAACLRAGFDIGAHRARQVRRADFGGFDLILACDRENLRDLKALAPAGCRARVRLLMDYAGIDGVDAVPDPYYGGPGDFDLAVRYCVAAAQGLARELAARL